MYARLSGHFAPISYFNCERVFFMSIVNPKTNKNFVDLKKISLIFKIFKNRFLLRQIFLNYIIYKPSLGSHEVPQQFGSDWFSRFNVYWIQTHRQTSKVYVWIQHHYTEIKTHFNNTFSNQSWNLLNGISLILIG